MIVKSEKDLVNTYTLDSSNFRGEAEKVYIPENEVELAELLKELNSQNKLVTISGAGTGLAGGRVPKGGVVVSSEKFNKIIEFNENKKTITVQSAVTTNEISEILEENGYFLPTNPTETTASIGGNVSTNASGSRTYLYGSMRNFVEELRIILTNGEILILNRNIKVDKVQNENLKEVISLTTLSGKEIQLPILNYEIPKFKHSAGYYTSQNIHPIDYFIGAEGTLGFISEITLNVMKKPDNILGLIVFFDDINKCISFVEELQNNKINYNDNSYKNLTTANPRLIEFFDKYSLKMLREKYTQIGTQYESAIWVEQELFFEHGINNEEKSDLILSSWYDLIVKYTNLSDETWVAQTPDEHRKFTEFRHTLPEKVYELIAHNNQYKVGVDGAVPNGNLSNLYNAIVEKSEKYNLNRVIYGHIGNNHLHGNVFYENERDKENAQKFYDEALEQVLKMKGTVSAEHGIGKLKVKYLEKMFGSEIINQMRSLKTSLDPNHILNIGNLFNF